MNIINNAFIGYIDFENRKAVKPQKLFLEDSTLDYIHEKLDKMFSQQIKEVKVCSKHELLEKGKKALNINFEDISIEVFEKLYSLGVNVDDMPNCHVLFLDYKTEEENLYIIIKLNNKKLETLKRVNIDNEDGIELTTRWQMPNAKSKVEEAVIVNTTLNTIHLIEKKFSIDEKLDTYLNNHWIKGELCRTDSDLLKIALKVIKNRNELYFLYNKSDLIANINHCIMTRKNKEENFNIFRFVEDVLADDCASAEAELVLEDLGITVDTTISSELIGDKYEYLNIKTNTGVEVKVGVEEYLADNYVSLSVQNGLQTLVVKDFDDIEVK